MVNIYLAMTVKACLSLFGALRNHLELARFGGCLTAEYDLFFVSRNISRNSVTVGKYWLAEYQMGFKL
jgi:hypothetical protein